MLVFEDALKMEPWFPDIWSVASGLTISGVNLAVGTSGQGEVRRSMLCKQWGLAPV